MVLSEWGVSKANFFNRMELDVNRSAVWDEQQNSGLSMID